MKQQTETILFNYFWNDSIIKIILISSNGLEAVYDEAAELLSELLTGVIHYGRLPELSSFKVIDLTNGEESEETGEAFRSFIDYLMDRV